MVVRVNKKGEKGRKKGKKSDPINTWNGEK